MGSRNQHRGWGKTRSYDQKPIGVLKTLLILQCVLSVAFPPALYASQKENAAPLVPFEPNASFYETDQEKVWDISYLERLQRETNVKNPAVQVPGRESKSLLSSIQSFFLPEAFANTLFSEDGYLIHVDAAATGYFAPGTKATITGTIERVDGDGNHHGCGPLGGKNLLELIQKQKLKLTFSFAGTNVTSAVTLSSNSCSLLTFTYKTALLALGSPVFDVTLKEHDGDLLSRYTAPLLVGNGYSAQSIQSTLIGRYLFTTTFDHGAQFQGEKVNVQARVEAVRPEGTQVEKTEAFWNGVKVGEVNRDLDPGQPVIFNYMTPPLGLVAQNSFRLKLTRRKLLGQGQTALGEFSALARVIGDAVSPQWLAGSTPDDTHSDVQVAQPLSATVQDALGHIDPASLQVTLDSNPAVGSASSQNITSKLTITWLDPATAQITGDLNPVLSGDGLYTLRLSAKDFSPNAAQPDPLTKVFVIDTHPPTLSNFLPQDSSIVTDFAIPVSFDSDERLAAVNLQGAPMTLSSDGKHASGTYTASNEGQFTLSIDAVDGAGNIAHANLHVEVLIRVLRPELVTVAPHPGDPAKTDIIGLPGAARPGADIQATSGFLNHASGIVSANGSFELTLAFFTQATLTATDSRLGKTESTSLSNGTGASTLLTGVVRDKQGHALSGALVSLAGTTIPPVVTNAEGTFTFTEIATGDQRLVIDATQVSQDPSIQPKRRFGIESLPITLGVGQRNIIPTLYLNGIPETAPVFDPEAGATISDSSGEIQLQIPGGAVQFPSSEDPNAPHHIFIERVPAERAMLGTPEFATPHTVVSLNPSGLQFSERVPITLGNLDHLAPGTPVVILSQGKGIWSVDGVAHVTSDGAAIHSDDGLGISHFSEIMAVPLPPGIRSIGSQDKPGANVFDGALTASIKTPETKIFGQGVSSSLIYRSSSADPRALLTGLFDFTKFDLHTTQSASGALIIAVEATDTTDVSYRPNKITSEFATTGIHTAPVSFQGANMPQKGAFSYSVPLVSQSDGQLLSTNLYPYTMHSVFELAETTLVTRRIKEKFLWWNISDESEVQRNETRVLNDLFPSDLQGSIFVQNQVQSEIGRGWRLAEAQRIVNPGASKLFIEESDGSVASYGIANSIETLYTAAGGVDLTYGVNLSRWPNAYVTSPTAIDFQSNNFSKVNLIDGSNAGTIGSIAAMGGNATINNDWRGQKGFFGNIEYRCNSEIFDYSVPTTAAALAPSPDGNQLAAVDSNRNALYYGSSNLGVALGQFGNNLGYVISANADVVESINFVFAQCAGLGIRCNHRTGFRFSTQDFGTDTNAINYCHNVSHQWMEPGSGPYPIAGGVLNHPVGVEAGQQPDTYVIADTGNHRVITYNVTTGANQVVAGNGQTFDSGDGDFAINAGVNHPRGVIYDQLGNLYITTAAGSVRKVDFTGRISTLVGASGATPGDNRPGREIVLNNPTGMAIDNVRGFLYIADTNNHVVRKLDLSTSLLTTVAGNFSGGFNGDQDSAVNASLNAPTHLGLDPSGNLLIADSGNQRIRRVVFESFTSGVIAYAPTSLDNSRIERDGNTTDTSRRYVRKYRNGTVAYLNEQGYQTLATNRAGQQVAYLYNASNQLTSIVHPDGRSTQYIYSDGFISQIIDPAGRSTYFQHIGGFLTRVTFPDNSTKSFQYDSSGLMTGETDQRGYLTTYQYNEWNRLATVTRPQAPAIHVNDVGSQMVSNNFDSGSPGSLKSLADTQNSITSPKGEVTSFKTDDAGFISEIKDPTGQVTKIFRNFRGQTTRLLRNFNDGGTPTLSSDDTWGSELVLTYDEATGDLLSQKDTETGVGTSQTFDAFGNQLTNTNARGFTSTAVFDAQTGLKVSVADPLGHGSSYAYTAQGLVSSTTNAAGKVSLATYDGNGNQTVATDALGRSTTVAHDAAGNVTRITNAKNQISTREYDLMNRLTAVITPKGERTEYSYLATGELAQIKDPVGGATTFEYNPLGQLTKRTDSLGFSISWQYDENGNIAAETDQNGNLKTYVYDSKGQLISKTLPDDKIEKTYDERGNVIQVINNETLVSTTFDILNRAKTISTSGRGIYSGTLPSLSLSFEYDRNGNRVLQSDPTGQTTYEFDEADRLTHLSNPYGEAYSFSWDSLNRPIAMTRPGSETTLTFDEINAISGIIHSSNGTTVATHGYTRDFINQVTSIQSSKGTTSVAKTIEYDLNNQLASMTDTEAPSSYQAETFTYDALYNRTGDQLGSYQYDSKRKQLVEDYRFFYFFDKNGNLTKKQAKIGFPNSEVVNYSYTSENQLRRIQFYAAGVTTAYKEVKYSYDALGRRVRKQTVDSTAPDDATKTFTRHYVYDGQEMLLEFDGSNQLLARHTHSGLRSDDVLATRVTSVGVSAHVALSQGTYTYLKDQQGSVIDVADSSGNRLMHYIYSAFGTIIGIQDAEAQELTGDSPLQTYFSYTGREYDHESGLYYYRARYYSSEIGKFLQKDPEPGALSDPVALTGEHNYASNDPVNRTDPSGKIAPVIIFALITVGASIVTGSIAAVLNANSARAKGLSEDKVSKSAFVGFLTGFFGGLLSIYFPPLAPLWGGAAAFLNNVGNQLIERGSFDKVNWRRAFIAGTAGAVVSFGLGKLLQIIPGADKVLTAEGQALISGPGGAAVGYCVDFGFGSDAEWEVFCGLTYRPSPSPQKTAP